MPYNQRRTQVYDFLTLADYLNFTACNAAHPARPMLAVHEVWRREVVYAYNAPVSMPASGGYGATVRTRAGSPYPITKDGKATPRCTQHRVLCMFPRIPQKEMQAKPYKVIHVNTCHTCPNVCSRYPGPPCKTHFAIP